MNKNDEKLFIIANELLRDVANQKITGVSVDNTNYEDGLKRLSINIDYVETSESNFKIKIGGLKNITLGDISGDIIKAGKINIQN
ncbi:MAG: hypothetical protein L0L90_10340 [Lactococcus lactis]|jgi:negative regulator of sigma E activity|nr:hypothetical protein [Lactococcus lactis]MDN6256160.1 hypothetical protein [Tetragenococcus koreensis]MDN5948145.1 hypothetical protein [Lactococcus lactis]MDN6220108.1 hypothetical protein [Lactococcus lactis]MDN6277826.1 hypothetical protein [Lactococcus lactis]